MRKLAIVRTDELSPNKTLFGATIIWRWCDDGRIQFVEQPEWHHWLTLYCYAWIIWSIFWMFQGVEPTTPVWVMSTVAGMVFAFNAILWWTGRYLVTIRTQVRGPGSYKDGRFVPEGEE